MNHLLAAVVLTALAATPALAQERARPAACADKPLPAATEGEAYAIDGDTIAVVGLKPHIRLWGIQAPELRDKRTGIETPFGMRSRAALEDMLTDAGRRIHYEPTKWDHYCRIVARVLFKPRSLPTADPMDASKIMIDRGMAYGFYLDDAIAAAPGLGKEYADAEAKARKSRTGFWSMWLGKPGPVWANVDD